MYYLHTNWSACMSYLNMCYLQGQPVRHSGKKQKDHDMSAGGIEKAHEMACVSLSNFSLYWKNFCPRCLLSRSAYQSSSSLCSDRPIKMNAISQSSLGATHTRGHYKPRKCTIIGEIPQNLLFAPPK